MKPIVGLFVFSAALFVRADLSAQESGGSPVPALSSSADKGNPVVTASLEERIAAARSVKVMTSLLGIELGSDLDEAHEKLDKLCSPSTPPKEEGEEADKKEREEKGKDAEQHEPQATQPKPGQEQEEGHKVLWQLAGTDYSALYVTADNQEHIDSITGFLRPEKQIPFAAIGEVSKAPAKDDRTVVWDVLRPDQPLFRVVASGSNGKASSIRLFLVQRKSAGVIRPQEK